MAPGPLGDQPADSSKHEVAGPIAVLEVRVAEAVEVEQHEGERVPVALGPLHVHLELGAEGTEREQALGQEVAKGRARRLALELCDPSSSGGKLSRHGFEFPRGAHSGWLLGGAQATLER